MLENKKAELLNSKAAHEESKAKEVVAALCLEKGQRVADIGSGGGYFSLMLAEGTARMTAPIPSSASLILWVMVISLGRVIPGKRSDPFFLSLLASRNVLAHNLTSTPFLTSNVESVIPQLVVPITATFCI